MRHIAKDKGEIVESSNALSEILSRVNPLAFLEVKGPFSEGVSKSSPAVSHHICCLVLYDLTRKLQVVPQNTIVIIIIKSGFCLPRAPTLSMSRNSQALEKNGKKRKTTSKNTSKSFDNDSGRMIFLCFTPIDFQ